MNYIETAIKDRAIVIPPDLQDKKDLILARCIEKNVPLVMNGEIIYCPINYLQNPKSE